MARVLPDARGKPRKVDPVTRAPNSMNQVKFDPRAWVLFSVSLAGSLCSSRLAPFFRQAPEAAESPSARLLLAELDANHDGHLSPFEAATSALALVRAADRDQSGEATADELSGYFDAREHDRQAEIDELISELDEDGDGAISQPEAPEEIWAFLRGSDLDSSGAVSRDELAASRPFESARPMIEAEFLGLLDEFDHHGSGSFRLDELRADLEHDAVEWLGALDQNMDGVVTRAELVARVDEELRGAEFTVSGRVARMSGVIGPSTPGRVLELILESPEVEVVELVNVPGSMDDEANLRAARMLHRAGLKTRVAEGGEIASGGVDFFLAGRNRTIRPGAKLGVHSWASGDGETGRDLDWDHPGHQMFLDFYDDVGVAPEFYWFTLEAAPAESIHWMTAEELGRFSLGLVETDDDGTAGSAEDNDGTDITPESHIGGCVLLDASAPVPADPFEVTPIRAASDLAPFAKTVTGAGIELRSEAGVPDEFLLLCAKSSYSMFVSSADKDRALQAAVVSAMHARRALLPVPRTEESFEQLLKEHSSAMETIERRHSVCDIIMAEVPTEMQVMEVVEHLLHTVTDVGLATVFPDEWGLTRSSDLGQAMERAIEAGYYNVDGYDDLAQLPTHIQDRILLQEFAYWYLTTRWDLQRRYGPDEEEWTFRSPEELATAFPAFDAVVTRTAGKVLSAPDGQLLLAIEAEAKRRSR